MTPSFYYCYVIWVPNGNEFLEGEGSPELKYDSSKKVFYNHKKISQKSSFDHQILFWEITLKPRRASESCTNTYE